MVKVFVILILGGSELQMFGLRWDSNEKTRINLMCPRIDDLELDIYSVRVFYSHVKIHAFVRGIEMFSVVTCVWMSLVLEHHRVQQLFMIQK